MASIATPIIIAYILTAGIGILLGGKEGWHMVNNGWVRTAIQVATVAGWFVSWLFRLTTKRWRQ